MSKTIQAEGSVVDVQLPQGVLRVEVVAPHTFRIRLRADGRFGPATLERYGVLCRTAERTKFEVEERGSHRVIRTGEATLEVGLADGRVTLGDGQGRTLLREAEAAWSDERQGFGAEFHLEEGERLYGLGDVARDRLNRRGYATPMWVKNVVSYVPIPFLMSTRHWGMLINTTWKHGVDVGQSAADRLRVAGRQGELDYFLFVGESLPALLQRYTAIAGRPVLLPLHAYGLTFVCNMRADAREMLEDGLNFRRERIPCDIIGLEPGWMSKFYDYSTEKQWDPEKFFIPSYLQKGPGNFMDAAERMGFKISLWLCCDYDLSYEEERNAAAKKPAEAEKLAAGGKPVFHEDDFEKDEHFQTVVRMDNVTKPQEAWFEHLKKFVDQGASAFKLDGSNQVIDHPDRKWANGMEDREMHNLYPLIYDKQMYQGYARYTKQRPMVYSAGGWTGVQQYVATWAGDTGGGAKPLVSLLNLGLSGHANTSCDMEIVTPAGIHFGFLQPWSQLNSWNYWRHPWFQGEKLGAMFKFYARLRYRLLPYIYSAAHVAHRTGLPIVRAMPLAFPEDPKGDELLGQYMFGDALLVAAFTDRVHLPAGRWIDYWTGQAHEGPEDLVYTPPAGRGGALFVRGGAIVPKWPLMQYVGQKSTQTVALDVFPHGESAFMLYEDDGLSLAYQAGEVATTTMRCRREGEALELEIGPRQGRYAGMPEARRYLVRLRSEAAPKALWVNGQAVASSDADGGGSMTSSASRCG